MTESQLQAFLARVKEDKDLQEKLNNASAEEAAVYYLQNYKDQWSGWLSDEARQNLASILDQG